MAEDCPARGKHDWVSHGPHQVRCTKCGKTDIVC